MACALACALVPAQSRRFRFHRLSPSRPAPKLSLPSLPTGERAAPPPPAGSSAGEYALDGKDSFGERGAPPPPARAAKSKEYTLEERLKARLANTTPEEIDAATRAKEKAARGRPWIEEAAIKGGGAAEKAKEEAIQEEAALKAAAAAVEKAEAERASAERASDQAEAAARANEAARLVAEAAAREAAEKAEAEAAAAEKAAEKATCWPRTHS